MKEYIKRRQRQWEDLWAREREELALEEAARVAKMEAEARKQEEIAARKKLLLEQQEAERLRQKRIEREEKLAEEKWNKQFDTLLAQIKERAQKNDELKEIRTIIDNREPPLQKLNWTTWLSDPLNQRLADLDFDRAMDVFKRDNLMAEALRSGDEAADPSARPTSSGRAKKFNHVLSFAGNSNVSTRTYDYVTTDFNPDDFDLNLGFTVSYWVRPDEVGNSMLAFGRKPHNNQRFGFGIYRKRQSYFGIGGNDMKTAWVNMDTPVEESLLVQDGSYWNLKTDGTWYHMVVTYDDRSDTSSGADRKVYVNGVLRHTNTINWSNTGASDGNIYFGARNVDGNYNNGWACALTQVAIFNTAKEADWVAKVYNSGKTGTNFTGQSGLVGYWKFNKGSGTTVKDYSGNGNHGSFGAISGDTTAHPTWERIWKARRPGAI